jgi:hypothetical protein
MRLERARNILFSYFFAMDSFIYAPKKKKEQKRKKKKIEINCSLPCVP